jgi:RNA polymerase primary sigma factor
MLENDIENLTPYVVVIAKRYKNFGVPLEDLIQEGKIGIIKARERFKKRKKVSFSAYAIWWIKQSILDCLSKQGRMIHHPNGKINLQRQVKEVKEIYIKTFHREPTDFEIKKELQLSEEEFFNTVTTAIPVVSIDNQIEDDEKGTFDILLKSDDNFFEEFDKSDLKIAINEGLKKLTKRERFIIEHFYGLNNKQKLALEDIGEKLGLTRERCRQIKNNSFKKMRKPIEDAYYF